MRYSWLICFALSVVALSAQLSQRPADATGEPKPGWRKAAENSATPAAEPPAEASGQFTVQPGTKVPLSMINSVSTRTAAEGDRVYLETVFPILVDGKIVIPPGSYVAGTVTQVKRPGRIKGKGELYVRFDSLTLPNGVTRQFGGHIGGLDGRATENLDRDEGKITSEGNKGGDARTVGETAATGASVGTLAGAVSGRPLTGLGVGAAGGAAAGLIGVLVSRGPDAMLTKGTTVEMVLDRPLQFEENELSFGPTQYRPASSEGSGPMPSQKNTERRRLGGIF